MEKLSGERRTHLRVTCLLYITALTQRGSTARTQTLHNAPVSPISSSLMILSYWRMSPPLLIECYTHQCCDCELQSKWQLLIRVKNCSDTSARQHALTSQGERRLAMHAALASALNAGDGPGVRQLLRGTPSLLNRCDFNGDPFLISAIRQGSPDVVRPLLGLLSPQEALDLMESSSGSGGGGMVGEEDASALLAAAADVDARNRAGENALHVCAPCVAALPLLPPITTPLFHFFRPSLPCWTRIFFHRGSARSRSTRASRRSSSSTRDRFRFPL